MKKINRMIWGKLSLQKERGSVRLIQVDKEESRERGRDGRMEEAGALWAQARGYRTTRCISNLDCFMEDGLEGGKKGTIPRMEGCCTNPGKKG